MADQNIIKVLLTPPLPILPSKTTTTSSEQILRVLQSDNSKTLRTERIWFLSNKSEIRSGWFCVQSLGVIIIRLQFQFLDKTMLCALERNTLFQIPPVQSTSKNEQSPRKNMYSRETRITSLELLTELCRLITAVYQNYMVG